MRKLTKEEALHIIAKIESDNAPNELLIDAYHNEIFNQMNDEMTEKEIFNLAEDMNIPLNQ